MNQNVNEAESFAADFVASEEGLLFFEVPKSVSNRRSPSGRRTGLDPSSQDGAGTCDEFHRYAKDCIESCRGRIELSRFAARAVALKASRREDLGCASPFLRQKS